MTRRILTTTSALAIAALLALAGQSAAAPKITEIELGQSGVAHYTMRDTVSGPTLGFSVPESAASDIIASLVVRDPSGAVVDIQTETPGSVDAALRGTPFEQGLPRDLASLLALLIGQEVSLTRPAGTVAGTMIGVRPPVPNKSSDAAIHARALVFDGTTLVEIELAPGVRVELSDENTDRLSDVLDDLRDDTDQRHFDLTLAGTDTRDVALSYVTEAPAWKNSYRLLLDEGRLQGWATFENLSGHDWQDVALTLSTGTPIAYRSHLIEPRIIARPDLKSVASPVVRPRPSNRNSGGGVMALSMAPPAPVMAEELDTASGTVSAFDAVNSNGILRYEMPGAIDLENGRTANLMYFDTPIEPELHALYRPLENPEAVFVAVGVQPDQGLAPGMISVQDGNGFVGDAPFAGTVAKERTLLPVAAAVGAKVVRVETLSARVDGATYSADRLNVEAVRFVETTYETPLPENLAVFTVEHPVSNAKLDSTNGEVERLTHAYRITVPVTEGLARVEITETEAYEKTIDVSVSGIGRFLSDIATGRVVAPEAMVASLSRAHALLVERAGIETELRTLADRYAEMQVEQERLRKNLETGVNVELRARYSQAMEKTESRILSLLDTQDALRARMAGLDQQIEAIFLAL